MKPSYSAQLLEEIEATPSEYLPALLNIVRTYRKSVSLEPAEEGLKRGLTEAFEDDSLPVEELWSGINAD